MAKIYVASSWRNSFYPEVVKRLREEGHEVYDFRNPPYGGNGFCWSDIDSNAPHCTFEQYTTGLHHPKAERQFSADMDALNWADTCVLVLPCGRSAHTEAGWMAGAGKRVIVYIPEMQEPELMYKLFDGIAGSLPDLLEFFGKKVSTHAYVPVQDYKKSLEPWVGKNPKVLILGTLAGDSSIKDIAYYNDNRNSFWRIIYSIFPPQPSEKSISRKDFIISKGIALWDCLASAVRKGSSDRGFVKGTEVANDIQGFLDDHPTVHTIVLNGTGTTANLFRKFCHIQANISVISLPSTASMIFYKDKIQAWSVLERLLR